MSRVDRVVRAGLFTAVLASSLSFGVVQAFAGPTEGEGATRACNTWQCDDYCKSRFGPESTGYSGRSGCTCS